MSQLEQREFALPKAGPSTERKINRLVAANGRFVTLAEIVLSTWKLEIVDPEKPEGEVFRRQENLTKSLFSKYAKRLGDAGLCLIEIQDQSVPRSQNGSINPEAVAFALTRIELWEKYGLQVITLQSKKGLKVCEVSGDRFQSLLDRQKMIIPPVPAAEKKYYKKAQEGSTEKLTRIEDIKDEGLKDFLASVVGRDSLLTQVYGPISSIDSRGPELDAQKLARITLDALGLQMLVMNGKTRARLVDILEAGIFYEKIDDGIRRQKSKFNLVQTIAFIIFYGEFRIIFDENNKDENVITNPQKIQKVKKRAIESAVARIGSSHILTEAFGIKGTKGHDEEEEDF